MKKLFVSYFKTLAVVAAVFVALGLFNAGMTAIITAGGAGAAVLALVFGLPAAFVAFDLFVTKKFDKDLGITPKVEDTDTSYDDDDTFDLDVGNCPDCGEEVCESSANIAADEANRAEFKKLKNEAVEAYFQRMKDDRALRDEVEYHEWLASGKTNPIS